MLFQMCVVHTKLDTVKPAKVVTSVKQPPVLKGHLFLILSENFISIEPLLIKRPPVFKCHFFSNVTSKYRFDCIYVFIIPPLHRREGMLFYLCRPSVRPKIFFVAFF